MKKILLDGAKPFYKANLHCHSTCSDGRKTPEEVKQMYIEKGYSVIAYTDHNVLIDKKYLSDESFLALNGYELDIKQSDENRFDFKHCHLCFIALESDNLTQACWHRTKYDYFKKRNTEKIKFDESKPDFERVYTPECVNAMIAEGRNNGFFVTYNHPAWSLETLDDYGRYEGMNAMEIFNNNSYTLGFPEYNPKIYDDILRGGQKIFCIATDDNHNAPALHDSFGGFTMINAEKLEYRTVTKALENGDFYASQGPEIYDLWYEDGKIGIKCSDAARIVLTTGNRRTERLYADENGFVNSAEFGVSEADSYVRITVTDAFGKNANTNAYFIEDLNKN